MVSGVVSILKSFHNRRKGKEPHVHITVGSNIGEINFPALVSCDDDDLSRVRRSVYLSKAHAHVVGVAARTRTYMRLGPASEQCTSIRSIVVRSTRVVLRVQII